MRSTQQVIDSLEEALRVRLLEEVVVAVRASEEAVEVEVTDCGTGVPDVLKRTLFSKFGSVEAALGSARRGIGLGLYLVRLVVEGRGGAVSTEDRPRGGESFRFWLQTRWLRKRPPESSRAGAVGGNGAEPTIPRGERVMH